MTIEDVWSRYDYPVATKLGAFEKFVPQTQLARFLVRYELFQHVLERQGSIVECGVRHGGGLFAWARLSALLEPYGSSRAIVGFDTFEGFPDVAPEDRGEAENPALVAGAHATGYDVLGELSELRELFDGMRILPQYRKIELVPGDARSTIPRWIEENPHALVSLLYLDFDLYEPTRVALERFLPRMPKGSLVVFDEPNCKEWPGETRALLETFDLQQRELLKFPFEANVSYLTV